MQSEQVDLTVGEVEARLGVVAKDLADCPKHGPYASIISRRCEKPSGCPQCAEIARLERDKEEQSEMFRRLEQNALAAKLGAALIPHRFKGKTFETYCATTEKQRAALRVCQRYAERFAENYEAGRCLMLLGTPGTGKTHLAAAIADHVMRNTKACAMYRTVGSILQYIKGSYGDSDYSEQQAFATLTKPELLIIDEVGATKATEFELATLFQIINSRYEEQLPTILISNLAPEEMAAAIGERCVDRLREGGGSAVVFDWDSARKEIR